jgi:hypothetical protein
MSLNIPERFLATARNDNQNKSFVISNEVRDLSQIEPLLHTGLRRYDRWT